MEFIIAIVALVVLGATYFCLGVILKFLLSWWILVFGAPILLIIGVSMGWMGLIVVVLGLAFLLKTNNRWHDNRLYLVLERKVDRAFYFSDT
jgi:hypothetical protein